MLRFPVHRGGEDDGLTALETAAHLDHALEQIACRDRILHGAAVFEGENIFLFAPLAYRLIRYDDRIFSMVGEDFYRCAASRTQTGHVALEVEHGLDGNTAAVAGKADGLHRDGRERRDTRGIHAVGGGKGDVGLLSGTQLVRIQLRRFCADAQRGKICDDRTGKAAADGLPGARHTEDCAGEGRGDRVSSHGLGFIRVRLHR